MEVAKLQRSRSRVHILVLVYNNNDTISNYAARSTLRRRTPTSHRCGDWVVVVVRE